jgi:hypothetical protein
MKRNFKRFMRMVEQKQQQVQNAIKEQERIMREAIRMKPTGEDRDRVEAEQCFELLKKRKVAYNSVKRYQNMLDFDFAANKIVICAYQSGILRTVQNMMIHNKSHHKHLPSNNSTQNLTKGAAKSSATASHTSSAGNNRRRPSQT